MDAQAHIAKLIADHKVVLFMKGSKSFPQCGFSSRVVELLKREGVPFETVNVLADPAIRQGIKDFSNWPTIPQLYVDGKFIGGCDIVTELAASGELAKELAPFKG
ncbi:MAG TPA: Grx4 family monothiol glutaredoxin [Polyangiaceae bacterium]|jgi:monothiol glutaredoxin|nr:Grx4 family monothiol glutaredoxin [Polyangiaceae bacterium]